MKTLAIDPASKCGYAWSDGTIVLSGVWLVGNDHDHCLRLRSFLLDAHHAWGIELMAAENSSFGNAKNRATQAKHNERLGVLRLVAAELGVRLVLYVPSTIKLQTTGSGRADKAQMIAAVRTRFGVVTTDDNVADAIAILKMVQAGIEPPAVARKKFAERVKKAAKRQGSFGFMAKQRRK